MKKENNIIIYQARNGEIKLKEDLENETIWASQAQIADVFEIERSVVTKHIKNILKDKELNEKGNVQKMHIANSDKPVSFYSLDLILAVGYRTKSSKAVQFRKWATKTLKDHILKGYTINKSRIKENYEQFLKIIEDIKILSNSRIGTNDVLELVKAFANTWFSLDAYDKDSFPKKGYTQKTFKSGIKELYSDVLKFKEELIKNGEATEFFAEERVKNNLEGIFENVFQSAFGEDVYKTVEEKSAHLLYFIIKDHPFIDGNKRTAAFSFIWLLRKAKVDFKNMITPQTLAALALLIT
ncbi:MAG: virulence protein RhuM/Fic/DOC family protein [Candidatus Pacebacteria bacterium]|nr:virulence protein RhuM/Fic/DOC family protein [Candidatus Paceibacterota bacterium]